MKKKEKTAFIDGFYFAQDIFTIAENGNFIIPLIDIVKNKITTLPSPEEIPKAKGISQELMEKVKNSYFENINKERKTNHNLEINRAKIILKTVCGKETLKNIIKEGDNESL